MNDLLLLTSSAQLTQESQSFQLKFYIFILIFYALKLYLSIEILFEFEGEPSVLDLLVKFRSVL